MNKYSYPLGKNIEKFITKYNRDLIERRNLILHKAKQRPLPIPPQEGGAQSYITAQRADINKMLRRVKRDMPQMGRYLEKNLKEINKRCNKVKYKGRYKKVYDQVATNLRRGMARNGM